MSERDVRAPEGGHGLDAGLPEVGTPEDSDGVKPLQTGLAQHVDFVVVRGQEGGDAVPAPPRIATPKPNCVGCLQVGVQGTASHHQHGLLQDRAEPDFWGAFDHHDRTLTGSSNTAWRSRG